MPAYETNAAVGAYDLRRRRTCWPVELPGSLRHRLLVPDRTSRPYMVDPKGEFKRCARCSRHGFTIAPQHKAWKGGYLTEEANGVYPMFFIGGTSTMPTRPTARACSTRRRSPTATRSSRPNRTTAVRRGRPRLSRPRWPRRSRRTTPRSRPQDWKDVMEIVDADVPDMPIMWAGSSLGLTIKVHGYIPAHPVGEPQPRLEGHRTRSASQPGPSESRVPGKRRFPRTVCHSRPSPRVLKYIVRPAAPALSDSCWACSWSFMRSCSSTCPAGRPGLRLEPSASAPTPTGGRPGRHGLGLDRPLYEQYFDYMARLLATVISGPRPRTGCRWPDKLLTRFPATMELTIAAIAINEPSDSARRGGRQAPAGCSTKLVFSLLGNLNSSTSSSACSSPTSCEMCAWLPVIGMTCVPTISAWVRRVPLKSLSDPLEHPEVRGCCEAPRPAAAQNIHWPTWPVDRLGGHRGAVRGLRPHGPGQGVARQAKSSAATSCATRCCKLSVIHLQTGLLLGGAILTETILPPGWRGIR